MYEAKNEAKEKKEEKGEEIFMHSASRSKRDRYRDFLLFAYYKFTFMLAFGRECSLIMQEFSARFFIAASLIYIQLNPHMFRCNRSI